MIKSANLSSTFLALTFAVVSGVGLASLTTKANASSLIDSCRVGSRNTVVACCNQYIRKHGTPLWMQGGAGKCSSVVVCNSYPVPGPVAKVPASYDGAIVSGFDNAVFTSFDVAIASNYHCYIKIPNDTLEGNPGLSEPRGRSKY